MRSRKEDPVPVVHVKDPVMSFDELDLDVQGVLDLSRQTGGPVVEPSFDAVGDLQGL